MGDWNLGSVVSAVLNLVEGVPSTISGTALLQIADQKREYCQNYTGIVIGSNAIPLKFQDPIVKLSASNVLTYMQIQGVDASAVKLGDFTINKGQGSNLNIAGESLKQMALDELNAIGRDIGFIKVND